MFASVLQVFAILLPRGNVFRDRVRACGFLQPLCDAFIFGIDLVLLDLVFAALGAFRAGVV
jgi:hypothetical protein